MGIAVLVAATSSVVGCVINPDGRPLGADAAAGLARLAGYRPECGCCEAGCGAPCDCGYVVCEPACGMPCDCPTCSCGDCCGAVDAGYVAPCEPASACVATARRKHRTPPPPVMPPGRFFPVPTHPVFEPQAPYGPALPCDF